MEEMNAQQTASPGADIVRLVREDSAAARLTRLSVLKEQFPEMDVEGIIAESGVPDLKKMRGKRDTYFFSDQSMTEAYAAHLFRIEEKDLLRLIAETVRDESQTYPRPTDARVFLGAPFNVAEHDLADTLERLAASPEYNDIRTCTASNGALYLYSSKYLGEAYAESLAEWMEVGQKENP